MARNGRPPLGLKLTEAERLSVGMTPGLVRVSVGLEHIDDIVADIDQALAASR